ncbi:MAG: hypothetical protein LH630_05635 [Actinomycetia bacterium]|nr:hypothetical protein [Actinomycetes bacterium]
MFVRGRLVIFVGIHLTTWLASVDLASPGATSLPDLPRSTEVFHEWLAKTRPGPSASGLRRPEFLMRPVKPVRRAFYAEPPAE